MSSESRPALKLVQGTGGEPVDYAWFCGRCAMPSTHGHAPAPAARVCRSCGLGVMLEARRDAVPSSRDAFLVIDSSLLVQAMSSSAETLLAVGEDAVVNRPVVELLVPADAEAGGASGFASALASAAAGSDQPVTAVVRPWSTFGVRMRARIAACGPPRAALVVLEESPTRRLRVVS